VDPLVDETGEPYAFTNDDPLNAVDPMGYMATNQFGEGCGGDIQDCGESTQHESDGNYYDAAPSGPASVPYASLPERSTSNVVRPSGSSVLGSMDAFFSAVSARIEAGRAAAEKDASGVWNAYANAVNSAPGASGLSTAISTGGHDLGCYVTGEWPGEFGKGALSNALIDSGASALGLGGMLRGLAKEAAEDGGPEGALAGLGVFLTGIGSGLIGSGLVSLGKTC
jgi:hypothetical protein